MTQKIDLRIRRTLTNIRNAFLELVIEVGFESLSVQSITERAMINRATFYRHYKDKYDLAERLLEVLFQFEPVPNADLLTQATQIFEHVDRYGEFYLVAVGKGGLPHFRERIQQEIETALMAQLEATGYVANPAQMPMALAARYMAAAQAGFVQWWLENDKPFPAEQAARYLLALHGQGGGRVLGLFSET